MDLNKLDERIKKTEEEKRELLRKEKSLRDAKRKYKESEVLKLLRKHNLTIIYSPEKKEIYDEVFQELSIKLENLQNIISDDRGNLNE